MYNKLNRLSMNLSKSTLRKSLFQEKPWYQSQKESPLSKLLKFTADFASKLPVLLQHRVMKWIDDFGLFFLRIGKIIQSSHQPYFLISCCLSGQKKITMLYQGDLTSFQFFLKRIFPNQQNPIITPIDQVSNKKKDIKKLQNDVDMVIYERDMFFNLYYQRKGYLVIPETISFILPLDQTIDEIINSCSLRVQNDLRKAKSLGYHYRIAHDFSSFSDFYHTMYLPYVTWKHKHLQKIISYESMKHYVLRRSNLLLVQIQNEAIFGGIYESEKQHITTQYSGIKQGKFDHIQQGIITISYYFLILIAKQYQMNYIDFGASTPFLNDGLNRYKRGWNMNITPSKPVFSTIFALRINNISDSLSSFFEANPTFYFKNHDLLLAYHINRNKEKMPTKQDIIKQNNLKGIEPTIYYSFEEFITNQ